jgi:hypothetical protein
MAYQERALLKELMNTIKWGMIWTGLRVWHKLYPLGLNLCVLKELIH